MNNKVSRRAFVSASVAVAASAMRYRPILGSNDRVRVGIIGCGDRGRASHIEDILSFASDCNVEIVAVCDPWRQMRELAVEQVKQSQGSSPRQFVHYQEMLSLQDLDAVTIATPEHQHCTQLTDAAQAGKDVYVEKPLAMNMEELLRASDAVEKAGCIVQNGTQIRSLPQAAAAKEFIRQGGIGKILKAAQARNGYRPYWLQYAERPISEKDVDWKAFLMHLPDRPFNPDQYAGWYGYREFSRGPHTTQGLHFVDTVHFITGAGIPRRAVAHFGTYSWKDHRTVPDSVEMVLEYEEDFVVRYSQIFGNGSGRYNTLFGSRGSIDCSDWSWDGTWPVSGDGCGPDAVPAETALPKAASVHHMKNWLDCIRTRREPNAPMSAGFAHAVAGIMADESHQRGKRMVYDPKTRTVSEG